MDVGLLKRELLACGKNTPSHKRWVLLLLALSLSSYGACKVCYLSRISGSSDKMSNLIGALSSLMEALCQTSEIIRVASKDVDFLQYETDRLPNSLGQMCKITKSTELSESVANLTEGVAVGIIRGFDASDRGLLDGLASPAGLTLVSTIIDSFVHCLTTEILDELRKHDYKDVLSTLRETKDLVEDFVQMLVGTAVSVYLEKTVDVNAFDNFFRAMTNPKHEAEIRETLVCVSSKAMETLVRTSHQVLSTPAMELTSSEQSSNEDLIKSNDWVGIISTILAVPSNRSLVLDITRLVTFEITRTFLDFLGEKMYGAITKCVKIIHEMIAQIKLQATKYVSEKLSAAAVLLLRVCLHMMDSIWMFSPV